MLAPTGQSRCSEENASPFSSLAEKLAALRLTLGGFEAPRPARSLGIAEIDARLPRGGLCLAGLHEVAAADFRSMPAAIGFLLALTRSVTRERRGPLLWPYLRKVGQAFGLPYGAGLNSFGFDPGDFLFARCCSPKDALWAMEEALRLGAAAAVVGERMPRTTLTISRRLQLAAESTATPIFLLRSPRDDAPSAARSCWRVRPHKSARDRFGLMTSPRWQVALTRARGGGVGEWVVEWDHDAVCLRLSSAVADRAPQPAEAREYARAETGSG